MKTSPDPTPTIETDLACIDCRYNLRTLPRDGKCPECGCPIWRSRLTRPDLRAFRRFERLRVLYAVAAIACLLATFIANSNRTHTTNLRAPENVAIRGFVSQCGLAALILLLAGVCWQLISAYPRGSRLVWVMMGLNALTFAFSSWPG